jgi:hypothetical protein
MGQIVSAAIMQGLWEKTRGGEKKKTQLDVDPEARQATQVAVVTNTWQADATEQPWHARHAAGREGS